MTLRHMRIFVTVCECESITAAAKKLYIAQPSVSLAIKELEEYYGVRLFDRISRKLYITEVGKQVLGYATNIVFLFEQVEKEIKNGDTFGTLKIGSSITIGNYLLPQYIQEFAKEFPHIKVQVTIDDSSQIEKKVISNEIDFALIEGIPHSLQIQSKKFRDDKLVLICGNNHPLLEQDEIEIQTLSEYDFVLREKGSGGREVFDSVMLIENIEIKPIWESVSTQAIVRAVMAGIGIGVLPYLFVKEELEAGRIKHLTIKNIELNHQFFMIHHKNKFLTKSAKEFMALCN